MPFWLNGLGYEAAFHIIHMFLWRRRTAASASAITFVVRLPFGITYFFYVRLAERGLSRLSTSGVGSFVCLTLRAYKL